MTRLPMLWPLRVSMTIRYRPRARIAIPSTGIPQIEIPGAVEHIALPGSVVFADLFDAENLSAVCAPKKLTSHSRATIGPAGSGARNLSGTRSRIEQVVDVTSPFVWNWAGRGEEQNCDGQLAHDRDDEAVDHQGEPPCARPRRARLRIGRMRSGRRRAAAAVRCRRGGRTPCRRHSAGRRRNRARSAQTRAERECRGDESRSG